MFNLHFLKRPYYFEESKTKRLSVSALISLFIFLFLYIFQPFELYSYVGNLFLLTLGYGVVTFLLTTIFILLLPTILPKYFGAEAWTTGKEILYILTLVLSIGLANLLYSTWMGVTNFSTEELLLFELYTLAVAVFPMMLLIFYRERQNFAQHATLSDEISKNLSKNEALIIPKATLHLSASNNTTLTLLPSDLFYLKSDANYIEIIYRKEEKIEKEIIRNTLKAMEEQLQTIDSFFRCHKSYIVNLDKIERISGNAQGLKLHLKGIENIVPVSRRNNELLKNRLTIYP